MAQGFIVVESGQGPLIQVNHVLGGQSSFPLDEFEELEVADEYGRMVAARFGIPFYSKLSGKSSYVRLEGQRA